MKGRTQKFKLCPMYVLPAAYLESQCLFSRLAIIALSLEHHLYLELTSIFFPSLVESCS